MTVSGTITATAVLFVLLLTATAGWMRTGGPDRPSMANDTYAVPGTGLGRAVSSVSACVFLLVFKPHLAKFVGPLCASRRVSSSERYRACTRRSTTASSCRPPAPRSPCSRVMLVLYRARIIKVTERFRTIVITATIGIMVFYGVCFLIQLFAGTDSVSFLASPSLLGIAFSVFVAGIAAMNLALDFDFIERGSKMGLEKGFEWYGAFGLLVTIVWLYLEMLRLLAKLRNR